MDCPLLPELMTVPVIDWPVAKIEDGELAGGRLIDSAPDCGGIKFWIVTENCVPAGRFVAPCTVVEGCDVSAKGEAVVCPCRAPCGALGGPPGVIGVPL